MALALPAKAPSPAPRIAAALAEMASARATTAANHPVRARPTASRRAVTRNATRVRTHPSARQTASTRCAATRSVSRRMAGPKDVHRTAPPPAATACAKSLKIGWVVQSIAAIAVTACAAPAPARRSRRLPAGATASQMLARWAATMASSARQTAVSPRGPVCTRGTATCARTAIRAVTTPAYSKWVAHIRPTARRAAMAWLAPGATCAQVALASPAT